MGDKEDEPLPQDDMDGVDSDEWVRWHRIIIIIINWCFVGWLNY